LELNFSKYVENATPGSLLLLRLAVGMILFTVVMVLTSSNLATNGIDSPRELNPAKDYEIFGRPGQFVLIAIGLLLCAGWVLASGWF
jgi:hypothetical protein